MRNHLVWSVIGILVGVSNSHAVGSGGISNATGISARATSMGLAAAANPDESAAVYFNPAFLSEFKGTAISLGTAFVNPKVEHTSTAGSKDKMENNYAVAPHLSFSFSPSGSKWGLGIGVNSPFGLITEWKDDSFSKYYATKSKLLMYQVNPSAAYSFSEKFSAAAGVSFVNIFDVELNQRVVNLDGGFMPLPNDGRGKFSGDGKGVGFNAGFRFEPSERHSFGLSYRSQVNVILKGETTLEGLDGLTALSFGGVSTYSTPANSEVKLPQSWLFGYGFKPSQRLTILVDYEWVDWASTKETKFNYDRNNSGLTQSIARRWRETSNVGLGVDWQLQESVSLRFGALAYEGAIPSGTLESSIPDTGRFSLSFGPGFKFGPTTLDLAYMAVFLEDETVNNSAGNTFASMNGEYEAMINIFNIGLTYRWGNPNS